MKKIIIRIVVILVGISIFRTFQTGEPTIYTEIKHDKTQLLDAIESLKKTSRFERIVALSDSIIAKFIKNISNKIREIHYNYYYVIDYCIDHYQKDSMLSSMTLNEWYEFKQNKSSWNVLKGASFSYNRGVSQNYRVEELKRIETEILRE